MTSEADAWHPPALSTTGASQTERAGHHADGRLSHGPREHSSGPQRVPPRGAARRHAGQTQADIGELAQRSGAGIAGRPGSRRRACPTHPRRCGSPSRETGGMPRASVYGRDMVPDRSSPAAAVDRPAIVGPGRAQPGSRPPHRAETPARARRNEARALAADANAALTSRREAKPHGAGSREPATTSPRKLAPVRSWCGAKLAGWSCSAGLSARDLTRPSACLHVETMRRPNRRSPAAPISPRPSPRALPLLPPSRPRSLRVVHAPGSWSGASAPHARRSPASRTMTTGPGPCPGGAILPRGS